MNDVYFEIFKDSFFANFALTLSEEFAYPLALSFGNADRVISSLSGLVGSVAGLSLTYLVFFGLAAVLKKLLASNPGYPAAQHYMNKFSPLICALAAFPMFTMIPAFFCGITKVKYWKFLMFTAIYRCLYYIYMIETVEKVIR